MQLYHFTSLIHLPKIMRSDLSRGEVPIGPFPRRRLPTAVNLTSNGSGKANADWNRGNLIDKTRVRLTVDLPDDQVTTFGQVRRRFKISRDWVRRLAPGQEYRNWYFAFGGVPLEKVLKVEIAVDSPGQFETVLQHQLLGICSLIESESAELPIVETKEGPAFFLEPSLVDSWLIDGPYVVDKWPASPLRRTLELSVAETTCVST